MNPSPPLALGPFALQQELGRGGMAVVWLGRHVEDDVPVAIKLVTGAGGRTEPFREALHREVEAMARLHHPHIVTVLDHGMVDGDCARASGGRLVEGTPYLAMEYLSGGTLAVPSSLRWPWLKGVLLSLLDALGHAHARGVIHRDLKPANILLAGPEDDGAGLRLTDFGISHAVDASRPSRYDDVICGSPSYMAPEQFRRDWRAYGPWTDLYALGCLSHLLACGRPPFPVRTLKQAAWQHLSEAPPPVPQQAWLPAGFSAWVLQLLSKQPAARFGTAADARAALLGLEGSSESSAALRVVVQEDLSTVTDFAPTILWEDPPPAAEPGAPVVPPARVRLLPRLPRRWRADGPPLALRLSGAGLGLYGLRTVPLVGREGIRDRLWSALRAAHDGDGVSGVLLQGAAGVGKSRLARWLVERASELGGISSLRATHDRRPGGRDGIGPMVARYLRLTGLERGECVRRIRIHLSGLGIEDGALAEALAWVVAPSGSGEQAPFAKPQERYTAVARWLAALSGQRPVVIWLDDVHWSRDSMAFGRWLLAQGGRLGVRALVLLTVRDSSPSHEEPPSPERARLEAEPELCCIDVPPLSPTEQRVLISELLGLSPDLAEQVSHRAGGVPLFAVQLVGDWVSRGILTMSRGGFELAPGCAPDLPDAIHDLCTSRLQRFVGDYGPGHREPLELAACLGGQVRMDEWRDACELAGLEIPPRLLERLVRARLSRRDGQDWSFSHGVLRESLERGAREAGSWPHWNEACARMLETPLRSERSETAERRAWHLWEAARHAEACEAFVEAARRRSMAGEYPPAEELLLKGLEAGQRGGVPAGSPVWGDLWVLRARVANLRGRLEEALELGARAVTLAREHGWPDRLVAGLLRRAQAGLQLDRLDEVALWLGEAERIASGLDDPGALGAVLRQQSRLVGLRGDSDAALVLGERAVKLLARSSRPGSQAEATRRLAYEYVRRGAHTTALRLAEEACAIARGGQAKLVIYNALITLGEVRRVSGALEQAAEAYAQAAEVARRTGCILPYISLGNAALVELQRGAWPAAREAIEEALELVATARGGFSRILESVFHLAFLPCLAEVGDWESWDRHLSRAESLLGKGGGRVEPDVGLATRIAGLRALAAGERERARGVWALGREHLLLGPPTPELQALEALLEENR